MEIKLDHQLHANLNRFSSLFQSKKLGIWQVVK